MKINKTLLLSILAMSLPAILEMALNTMLGMADTIMISRFIGKEALASVGFANQIMFLLIFVFSSFNTGAIALISRAYGEQNFKKLKDIATQSITLNLLIGIIILFLSVILSNYIFRIFDVSQEVYNNSVLYFKIILVGIIPMFISFAFSAILRGAGDTVTPMRITAIANILNIIGNYVLIKGVGPFPELGIAGAAWSTTISRFIALLLYIYKIYIKDSSIKLKPSLFLSKKIVKPLWEISLPGGIEQGLMQLSFVVLGVIVSKLDTISEATFRILIQIESLSFMPAVGMSIAAATLVGQSLGEKNENKAVEIGYLSSFLGILWGIFIGLLFILFPSSAIVVFSKESSILETGIGVMLFMGINQLGLNFVIVMSGALRGAGDTKFVMIVTVLRLWLIFIPLSYLFINRMNLGLAGVWYAEIISFIVFSTQFFFRFKSRKWVKDI